RGARVALEQPARTEIAAEPDLCVSGPELRLIRRDAQITSQADAQSRAHRVAVDGGDGHFRRVVKQPGQRLGLAHTVTLFFERLWRVAFTSHHRNIAARAKSPPRARDHNRSDFRIEAPAFQALN